MVREAIEYYHDLLDDNLAAESDAYMREKQRERNLYFGDRPVCVVLRPHFYMLDDWLFVKERMEVLLSALNKVHQTCLSSDTHRAQLCLWDFEEELFHMDTEHTSNGIPPWTSSRMDTFFVVEDRDMKCVEYNAETPAGIGYGDVLNEVFWDSPAMRLFRERFFCRPMAGQNLLTDALMIAYTRWRETSQPEIPQIAILDWHDVPTLNEHEITRQYFERFLGTKAILADPHNLEYRDGNLYHEDFRIDMVYKRVLWSELAERMGTHNAITNAMRDRAVYLTNSPSAKLLAKKASLSFLSDERNADLFGAAELQAIRDHIPWTRTVEERKTLRNGSEVDLIDHIAQHRNDFVLKPNDEYGGKGVVLGWDCTDEEWSETLQTALETPFVVQEKVRIVERDFPAWIDNKVDISRRYVDADPYIFSGTNVGGVLTRLSPAKLLNVTAGTGSVVPAFVLEERGN